MQVLGGSTPEIALDFMPPVALPLPGSAILGRYDHFVSSTSFLHPFAQPLFRLFRLVITRPVRTVNTYLLATTTRTTRA